MSAQKGLSKLAWRQDQRWGRLENPVSSPGSCLLASSYFNQYELSNSEPTEVQHSVALPFLAGHMTSTPAFHLPLEFLCVKRWVEQWGGSTGVGARRQGRQLLLLSQKLCGGSDTTPVLVRRVQSKVRVAGDCGAAPLAFSAVAAMRRRAQRSCPGLYIRSAAQKPLSTA